MKKSAKKRRQVPAGARKRHISKRVVDAMTEGQYVSDDMVAGFCVRQRNGRRVYGFKYSVNGASDRWITIGENGKAWRPDPVRGASRSLTPDLARLEAERLRGIVADGRDPARDRDVVRSIPSMADFSGRYRRDYSAVHHKASTAAMEGVMLDKKIVPRFGTWRLDQIDSAAISEWLSPMGKEQAAYANRIIGTLSRVMAFAIRLKVLKGENPCSGVRRFRTVARDRLLTHEELQRLGSVLLSQKSGMTKLSRGAILICMFTGARRGEIVPLRWEQLDAAPDVEIVIGKDEHGRDIVVIGKQVMQEGKTGRRPIVFPPAALLVLRELAPTKDDRISPWLFPIRRGQGHMTGTGLSLAFLRCARKAGVENATLHDLRRLFISTAVEGGRNSLHAARLAGHATSQITERVYTILPSASLVSLAEATAAQIRGALEAPSEET